MIFSANILSFTVLFFISSFAAHLYSAANEALARQFAKTLALPRAPHCTNVEGKSTGFDLAGCGPVAGVPSLSITNASVVVDRAVSTTTATGAVAATGAESTVAGSSMAPVAAVAEVFQSKYSADDAKQEAIRITLKQRKKESAYDKMLSSTQEFESIFAHVCASSPVLPSTLVGVVARYATPSPWHTHILASVYAQKGREQVYSKSGVSAVRLDDDSVVFFNSNGTKRGRWAGRGIPVGSLAGTLDGSLFAAALGDGRVIFLHSDGTEVSTWMGETVGMSLAWAHDGRTLAVGLLCRGKVVFLNSDGTQRSTWVWGSDTSVWSLVWSPDGKMVVARLGDDGGVVILNSDGTERARWLKRRAYAWCVDWSPDGTTIAVGLNDGSVVFLNADGAERTTWDGVGASAWCVAWAPDGATLAVGLTRGGVVLLNPEGVQCNRWVDRKNTKVESLCWVGEGNRLAVQLKHRTIRFLRCRSKPLRPHSSVVATVTEGNEATTTAGGASAARCSKRSLQVHTSLVTCTSALIRAAVESIRNCMRRTDSVRTFIHSCKCSKKRDDYF